MLAQTYSSPKNAVITNSLSFYGGKLDSKLTPAFA